MQVHLAQPGCFLFEILVQMQLPLIRKVIDLTGKILPVDLRVWHPMAVKTLDEAPWTLRPGSFRCANGFPHTAHFGLHDGQVWCGLQNLIQAVTPPAHAVFAIHPAFAQPDAERIQLRPLGIGLCSGVIKSALDFAGLTLMDFHHHAAKKHTDWQRQFRMRWGWTFTHRIQNHGLPRLTPTRAELWRWCISFSS